MNVKEIASLFLGKLSNILKRLHRGESLKICCQIKCERNDYKRLGENTKIQKNSAFRFICNHFKFSFHFKELNIRNGDDVCGAS